MGSVWIFLFNHSMTAGYMILAILLLRFFLRNAPKWIRNILWALVGIRLMVPISVKSVFSLIPSAEIINQTTVQYSQTPAISSGIPWIDRTVNPTISQAFRPEPGASINPLHIFTEIAGYTWLLGLIVMILYAGISIVKIQRAMRESIHVRDNLYACDFVQSPLILGFFRPRIYIPPNMDTKTENLIVAHEKTHIQRGDHFWKPLGFVILSIYWFHPLCWIAYMLLCRDIELTCDEQVIKNLDRDDIANYSETLLRFNFPPKWAIACPVAFGEIGVKARVRAILHYKKPTWKITVISLMVCALTAICFLTNPVSSENIKESSLLHYTQNHDGTYTAENGMTYHYQLTLTGRSPNASCTVCFTLLSNDESLTFERVNESFFTSHTERFLKIEDAVIVAIDYIEEKAQNL